MVSIIQNILGKVNLQLTRVQILDLHLDLYKKKFPSESLQEKKFYNIGAGSFSHPYWTNVDYSSDWYDKNEKYTQQGIQYDLHALEPLPIEDDSAEIIYSSHTIEHITNDAAINLFKESYRALKPGGVIRLTCPNVDLFYRAYARKDFNFFYWKDWYTTPDQYKRVQLAKPLSTASIEQLFLQKVATCRSTLYEYDADLIERIDDEGLSKIFAENTLEEALDILVQGCPLEIQRKFPGNHINWWNHNKLTDALKKAGFSNVFISGHNQSVSPVMRNTDLFDSTHPRISLYVEAIK